MAMPRCISGFPEFLPAQQQLFEKYKKALATCFESHGFCAMETPAVERLETLSSKGTDHEIYVLSRWAEEDAAAPKEMGLRFDLTVPLARYVAQHHSDLVFPYRRYHIAPVWRGERPQKGRYRQFYQCDIDIMGRGDLSPLYDGEVAAIMIKALGGLYKGPVTLHLNHRKILEAWMATVGIHDHVAAMRLVDKRGKVPLDFIDQELCALSMKPGAFLSLAQDLESCGSLEERVVLFQQLLASQTGPLEEVRQLLGVMEAMGISRSVISLDPLLARGLTYYTGSVYEVTLDNHPQLGTVCAGGRYGNLAENFSSQVFPGVGMSLGLSRIFPALLAEGVEAAPWVDIVVTVQEPSLVPAYLQLADTLRSGGLRVESFLDAKPLKAQLKYASQKGIPWVVVANEAELSQGHAHLRHLASGQQVFLPFDRIITHVVGADDRC